MQSFDSLIRLTSLIHNKECPSRSKESLKVVNKYSGKELATIA